MNIGFIWCEENMQQEAPGNVVMNLLVPYKAGISSLAEQYSSSLYRMLCGVCVI